MKLNRCHSDEEWPPPPWYHTSLPPWCVKQPQNSPIWHIPGRQNDHSSSMRGGLELFGMYFFCYIFFYYTNEISYDYDYQQLHLDKSGTSTLSRQSPTTQKKGPNDSSYCCLGLEMPVMSATSRWPQTTIIDNEWGLETGLEPPCMWRNKQVLGRQRQGLETCTCLEPPSLFINT